MAAGAGAYPKPDSDRIGAKRQSFEWTNLPESGNNNPVPPMPIGVFSLEAQDKWHSLWRLPQSLMWYNLVEVVEKYIYLYNDFIFAEKKAPLSAQMTACEDRLGLSPKAFMQLRWRIVPDALADPKFVGGEEVSSAPLAIVKEIKKEEIDFDA